RTLTKSGAGQLALLSLRCSGVTINAGTAAVLHTSGGESGASYINALSIAPSAALDLKDNDLVVSYGTRPSPFTQIQDYVFSGFAQTPTPGMTGIISTTGQSAGNTILALVDNALFGAPEWPPGSGHTI